MPDIQGAADLGKPVMAQPQQQGVRVPPIPPPEPKKIKWLTPELAAQAAELASLVDVNFERFSALRAIGVTIPAAKILETKLEAVVDTLFPTDTRKGQFHRLEFERAFERGMREVIGHAEKQSGIVMDEVKAQLRQQFLAGRVDGMTDTQIIEMATFLNMPVPEGLLKGTG